MLMMGPWRGPLAARHEARSIASSRWRTFAPFSLRHAGELDAVAVFSFSLDHFFAFCAVT